MVIEAKLELKKDNVRDVVEEQCKDILDTLSSNDLMDFYKTLCGFKDNGDDKYVVNVKNKKDLIKEYIISLKSQNKADTTISDYAKTFKKFIKFMEEQGIDLKMITIKEIEEYLFKCNNSGISINTYIKLVNCLKGCLRFLYSRGYIIRDFAALIKTPAKVEPVKAILSDMDIKKIESYLVSRKQNYKNENLRDGLIFYLGVDCGLRRQEIINLKWQDINFSDCSIDIKKSKGGKSRVVYFNDRLKGLLLAYRQATGKYIGAAVRGMHQKRITKCALQNIITRIYRETGLKKEALPCIA